MVAPTPGGVVSLRSTEPLQASLFYDSGLTYQCNRCHLRPNGHHCLRRRPAIRRLDLPEYEPTPSVAAPESAHAARCASRFPGI
jgi:hypothetical protein